MASGHVQMYQVNKTSEVGLAAKQTLSLVSVSALLCIMVDEVINCCNKFKHLVYLNI